mmetsp:Transcript_33617/g.57139  ORF Transcript_33617/g.57139 Transcript_33617/m.57139 type:complete len:81 (+) Transcript_33617:398-640(+)|eukprot:CAMPEP_0184414714 /NCGR_PEP_ID=MMETSP0738-20130409/8224_1 /TAXON_ID=385413 /ORGANISM="Thalassiosira miniscula, Strain CCMP1093" /LENGTH=80 /DNA_ID=CAMNT_0026773791 /DNA_START=239 /DNA_END=481 /DNA_ORIENTATION=-
MRMKGADSMMAVLSMVMEVLTKMMTRGSHDGGAVAGMEVLAGNDRRSSGDNDIRSNGQYGNTHNEHTIVLRMIDCTHHQK